MYKFNVSKISATKKYFGQQVPSQEEKDNLKRLCGCTFLKVVQKYHPYFEIDIYEFNKFLQHITVEDFRMNFHISYFVCKVKHYFPAHICEFEGNKRIIAKGSTKKSSKNQVYNIYVSTVTPSKNEKIKYNYDLQGIIDKVDVEMPVFGTSK